MFFIYTYLFHTQQLYTPCSDQNVHTQTPKHSTIYCIKLGYYCMVYRNCVLWTFSVRLCIDLLYIYVPLL